MSDVHEHIDVSNIDELIQSNAKQDTYVRDYYYYYSYIIEDYSDYYNRKYE